MAFKNPTRQNIYMGEFADDAAALVYIRAQLWDSTKNGAGNPEPGMLYYDTTLTVMKHYQNGAWQVLADRTWTNAQILAAVIAGRDWKELLLVQDQLITGAAGGVGPAILLSVTGLPSATDTLTISDGVAPEVYTFVAGAPGAFEIQIGGNVAACMANIVTSLAANSLLWRGVVTGALDEYFAGAPAVQLVIRRILAVATSACNDRIFATLTGVGAIQVVDFAQVGESDYEFSAGTEAAIPAVDPAARRFGFGRAHAAMQESEKHGLVEQEMGYSWDPDTNTWRRVYAPEAPRNFTLAGNPNAGAGTAGNRGDICIDTVGGVIYMNLDGTATGWVVIG